MLNTFRELFSKKFANLNLLEISSKNLIHNYKYLSSLNRNIQIAPVLKSNAYGHDIKTIATLLEPLNPPFVCVDSLYEAYELLKAKIKTPILIMGYVGPQNITHKKLPFNYAVWDIEMAKTIAKHQPHAKIHIFVDTGMHREGVPMDKLNEFLEELKEIPNINVDGVMSHLAKGEDANDKRTRKQFIEFKKAVDLVKKSGYKPKWVHLLNSPSLMTHHSLKNINISNLARTGKALYGISPVGDDKNLKPVAKLISTIVQVKKLKAGETIGYDFTYTAKNTITIAILPIGYNDGLNRLLSNKGLVIVNGIYCPIIGRVSMNLTTIDVSKVKDVEVGQKAVIYSSVPKDKNSIKSLSRLCETIPYELMVHLTPTTKRVVV